LLKINLASMQGAKAGHVKTAGHCPGLLSLRTFQCRRPVWKRLFICGPLARASMSFGMICDGVRDIYTLGHFGREMKVLASSAITGPDTKSYSVIAVIGRDSRAAPLRTKEARDGAYRIHDPFSNDLSLRRGMVGGAMTRHSISLRRLRDLWAIRPVRKSTC
jgi:hypothetical protein